MSARRRAVLVALAATGLVIAGWLTLVQVDVLGGPWDPVFGPASSRTVLDLTKPVPDAAAGVAAYAAELVLLLAGARASGPLARWASPLLGLVLMGGAAVSVALIVIQPAVAGAWCLLCLASAATSLALAVLGRDEIRAALDLVHGSPPNRPHAARGVASPGRG